MSFAIVVIINKAFKLFQLVLVVYCDSCCHWWYPGNSAGQKTCITPYKRPETLVWVYIGARLYFHRRLWFCPRGGCLVLGVCSGGVPGPGGSAPTWWRPPPPDGYCCGRCASYWNAFLSNIHWRNQGKCTPGTISFILKQFEKSCQIRMYSSRMRTHCFIAAVAATKCHYCGGLPIPLDGNLFPSGWRPDRKWHHTPRRKMGPDKKWHHPPPPRWHRHV